MLCKGMESSASGPSIRATASHGSCFRKPLTIHGYRIITVESWDDDPIFSRVPGTPSPVYVGVTVEAEHDAVKEALNALGLIKENRPPGDSWLVKRGQRRHLYRAFCGQA